MSILTFSLSFKIFFSFRKEAGAQRQGETQSLKATCIYFCLAYPVLVSRFLACLSPLTILVSRRTGLHLNFHQCTVLHLSLYIVC
jgi:hypothetical protein